MREKRLKAQTSAGKVMASVLWASEGMSLMEFLKRCATNQFTATRADVKEVNRSRTGDADLRF
jgi:hypothetical protein